MLTQDNKASTKHLANKEISGKNAITKMAYLLNCETMELIVDGYLSSHQVTPTFLLDLHALLFDLFHIL